jgi:ribosomal protein L11 methylase PrmA
MDALSKAGKTGGFLVLSGLLIEDQEDMINLSHSKGWQFIQQKNKNGWISLLFKKG